MFGQCPIFVYLELRSILMLCEQAKIGEAWDAGRIFTKNVFFVCPASCCSAGVLILYMGLLLVFAVMFEKNYRQSLKKRIPWNQRAGDA